MEVQQIYKKRKWQNHDKAEEFFVQRHWAMWGIMSAANGQDAVLE